MRLGPALALSLLASGATACADASGRFQAFEDRRVERSGAAGESPAGGGGADADCQPPAPGVVEGPALLALETSTVPGAAILFFGDLETPALGGKTAVKFSYQALAVADRRTRVGEPLVVGPFVIEDDGSFDAPTEESTLPGSANALSPGLPITSQLTLHGTICGASDFHCGTVTGNVTAPLKAETTGRFGITLVRSLDDLPPRPRFGCEADALAPALE
jgi:hypothetical protein